MSGEGILRPLNGKGWQVQTTNEIAKPRLAALMGTSSRKNIFDTVAEKLSSQGIGTHFYLEDFSRPVEESLPISEIGGILAMTGVPVPSGFLSSVKKEKVPLVCAGLHSEEGYDTVTTDNVYAVREAVKILFESGHRRILFVATEIEDMSFRIRTETFIKVSKELGLSSETLTIKLNWVSPKDDAARLIGLLRNSHFDAVFTVSEPIAHSLFIVLAREGIQVPDDISLICVGEGYHVPDSPGAYYGIESFAPVSHDWPKIMGVAAERLFSRMDGDSSHSEMILIAPKRSKVSSIKQRKLK